MRRWLSRRRQLPMIFLRSAIDVVAVENDPRLTISFAITPEEERLLLLDEVEDTQVTSLLQKLLSGETFGVEDFPGGDTSFCPKVDSAHGADQCGEENPVPNPVHRRNLRPRKPVDVKIQDISSEEDSEPAVFLAQMGVRDEKMQAFSMRRFQPRLRRWRETYVGIWVCPRESSVIAGRGKQATIIMYRLPPLRVVALNHGLTRAAETGQLQLRDRGLKKKVSAKGRVAATLDRLPRQCADDSQYLAHRRRTHGPCAGATHLRNLIDQQPQTPSTALITCRDPLCVQPQSYVLPPEVPSIFRYGAEGGSPVAWEKTNPHRYRSVGSVRSCHPPRGAKFDSKAKEGDRLGHNKSVTAQYAPPDLSHRQNEESVKERTIEPLEDPTHKETIVPDASTGEVSGVQETIVPDASTGEVSGVQEAVTPTDVNYSQQEENRHERDLDPLGPGTEENIASRCRREHSEKRFSYC
ncbi:hypothetical protein Bca4012_037430 [Brassica carinata]